MSACEKYMMNDVKGPTRQMFTVVYYYKDGKVVGESKYVDGDIKYYELLGARREVRERVNLDYSVFEKVIDETAYTKAMNEYNAEKAKRREQFVADMMQENNLTRGEVQYFYETSNGFIEAKENMDEFTDYRERYN